ncbi:MAG: extracellular solute-binding protein [Lachnospiraceae bacterium]|nr:extracellular solute-binding protein [Lachnospiraceae bacterium]
MTTLKEVADLAGVSIATVSYCINGTKNIKPETRLKVMRAIEELNYIPNRSAKNLREPDTQEIGIVIPDIEDHYYSEILKGIVYEAENANYALNIAFTYRTPNQECKIIQDFISRNVSGLAILTCQPSNTDFFKNSVVRYHIPCVFIDRIPQGLNVNFQTFDNYTTIHYLTRQLLLKGYHTIGLMTGPEDLLSESDCIYAFTDAHIEHKKVYFPDFIYSCDMTKEGAFRIFMNSLHRGIPQAIISSSEDMTKGIVEVLNLCHIRIPEDICVITLGVECWNSSNYHPHVLHTSRQAYTLGKNCCQLLLRNIQSPHLFEPEFMLHQERHLEDSLVFPPPPRPFSFPTSQKKLKILALSLPTVRALDAVSLEFSRLYGTQVEIDYLPMRELFHAICQDSQRPQSEYDVYVVDVSWMRYLIQEKLLMDITDFIQSCTLETTHMIPKNLENCCYRGRYYGLPIIGGTHLLFYRKDFFTSTKLQQAFKEQHHISLRPPKTWTEFNGIARFFTRSLNPESPSTYGTSLPASMSEELALEILVRLWSFGGGLFDQNNRLLLNTPQNIRGYQSILETCSYASPHFMTHNHQKSFHDFSTGKTAMLISFTEYAGDLKNYVSSDMLSNVGYCNLPGGTPANVGWQMGISKSTKNKALIEDLFKWICTKHTSYYLTILDGQAVMKYPYQNHELLKLYPWLDLTDEGIRLSHSRIYPLRGKSGNIPPYQVEAVLCQTFYRIWENGMPIEEALADAQHELYQLFA